MRTILFDSRLVLRYPEYDNEVTPHSLSPEPTPHEWPAAPPRGLVICCPLKIIPDAKHPLDPGRPQGERPGEVGLQHIYK